MPSTGISVRSNRAIALRASSSATVCGVDTITAPLIGIPCAMASCASPVPGGMSIMRTSSGPSPPSQSTSVRNCRIAPVTIGPRQTTGSRPPTRKPVETSFTPCACNGTMPASVLRRPGASVRPNRRGALGPNTSASTRPVRNPCRTHAPARLAATVDLPTPPLPDPTAMISGAGAFAGEGALRFASRTGRRSVSTMILTRSIPSTASTAFSARARRPASSSAPSPPSGGVRMMVAIAERTSTAETRAFSSGSCVSSACRTVCAESSCMACS